MLPVSQSSAMPSRSLACTSWESLSNSAHGRRAIVIGKGPSLDAWLSQSASLSLAQASDILIGVNHAAALVPCHYAVTNHGDHRPYAAIDTQWLVSLPLHPHSMHHAQWQKPTWATHWFRHTTGFDLLQQSREQIADLHSLWNQSSSANPAIHFAWYLGCTNLLCVGLDGGHGYSQSAFHRTDTPPPKKDGYAQNRRDTEHGASILFGTRWSHWGPP